MELKFNSYSNENVFYGLKLSTWLSYIHILKRELLWANHFTFRGINFFHVKNEVTWSGWSLKFLYLQASMILWLYNICLVGFCKNWCLWNNLILMMKDFMLVPKTILIKMKHAREILSTFLSKTKCKEQFWLTCVLILWLMRPIVVAWDLDIMTRKSDSLNKRTRAGTTKR